MSADSPLPSSASPAAARWRVLGPPRTRPGRWAAGLAAAFVGLYAINAAIFMQLQSEAAWLRILLIFYGFTILACGLAAGVAALIALLRRRERSLFVWLALLPGLLVLALMIGEFAVPH